MKSTVIGIAALGAAAAFAAVIGCSGGGGGSSGSGGTAQINGTLTRGTGVQTAAAGGSRTWLARARSLVATPSAIAEGTTACGNPAVSAAGVPVSLLLGGAVVQTTVTDANGEFQFTGLAPGDYVIQVTLPSGTISAPALVQPGQTTAVAGELEVDCEDVDDDNNKTEISLEVKEQAEDGSHLEGHHTEDGGAFESEVNDGNQVEHQSGHDGNREDEQDSSGASENSGPGSTSSGSGSSHDGGSDDGGNHD
jgi:hypothetical protein